MREKTFDTTRTHICLKIAFRLQQNAFIPQLFCFRQKSNFIKKKQNNFIININLLRINTILGQIYPIGFNKNIL